MFKLEEMFPDDLDQYLINKKSIAIIPMGAIEQHGPHLLLGCDTYVSMALADYTAELCEGISFPALPYSWIGGLRVWPGSINIRPENMGDYLEAVVKGVIEMGINKIVILNTHGGGIEMVSSICSKIYKSTKIPVLGIYHTDLYPLNHELMSVCESCGIGYTDSAFEASELMGAVKKMNRQDLLSKLERLKEEALSEFGESNGVVEPASLIKVFEFGDVGNDYLNEILHVAPRRLASARAGTAFLEAEAEILAKVINKFVDYHEQLDI